MTREEAIERLEDTFEGWNMWVLHNDSPASKMSKALGMAISALREQPRWISVEERLPEKKGQYLVYTKWAYGSFIRLSNWTPKYNGWEEHLSGRAIWYNYDSEYGDYECKDITHWMQLPDAPEVEG